MNEPTRATTSLGPTGFTTAATSRGHQFVFDEPLDQGGADAGPKPTEMVLAALAACTAITIRMYALRKGWDLAGVTSEATLASDGKTRSIAHTVRLAGNLDAEQRERLRAIAHSCPVHRMLEGSVAITTEMV